MFPNQNKIPQESLTALNYLNCPKNISKDKNLNVLNELNSKKSSQNPT